MDNHKKEIWCTPCAFAQLQFKVTLCTPFYTPEQPHFTLTIYVSVAMWEDLESSSENLVKVVSVTWFLRHGHDTCIYKSVEQIVSGLKWRGPATGISNYKKQLAITRSLLLSCYLCWQSPKSSSTILSEETVQEDGQSLWRTYAYDLCKNKTQNNEVIIIRS